ncbi:hypothetical protein BDP27DRAFT_1374218 [Rhodocollybia butyracea]|uniref:Uncharacterized protein n=1 Tax=Rhodocollybia butyracea TaxID=206335 RepID=A0A9P5P537_9AGAR|nr:hypothetical protein BDP27DRAFT_1374218 [Rhodocollybia butyracea]
MTTSLEYSVRDPTRQLRLLDFPTKAVDLGSLLILLPTCIPDRSRMLQPNNLSPLGPWRLRPGPAQLGPTKRARSHHQRPGKYGTVAERTRMAKYMEQNPNTGLCPPILSVPDVLRWLIDKAPGVCTPLIFSRLFIILLFQKNGIYYQSLLSRAQRDGQLERLVLPQLCVLSAALFYEDIRDQKSSPPMLVVLAPYIDNTFPSLYDSYQSLAPGEIA